MNAIITISLFVYIASMIFPANREVTTGWFNTIRYIALVLVPVLNTVVTYRMIKKIKLTTM